MFLNIRKIITLVKNVYPLKRLIFYTLFVFGLITVKAQDSSCVKLWGAGIEYYYSVNGHGAFISPHLSYSSGKHQLKIGPTIHKRSMQVKGAKLSYSFLLAGMDGEEKFNTNFRDNKNGTWRVNLYSYLQFVDYTGLSYDRAKEETVLSADSTINWNNVYLSTAEGGLGAEIDVKLLNYFLLRAYVGVTVYSYLNYPTGMYQDKTGAAFVAGIGINVPTFRRTKSK